MRNKEMITDLQAVVVYLRIVGAVYPIAPGKAIETIERAIALLSEDETEANRELQS